MIAQAVKNNLRDINKLKMRTKATKYSNLFSTAPTVTQEDNIVPLFYESAMEEELKNDVDEIEIADNHNAEISQSDLDEISEYIVEDPNEVVVTLPVVTNVVGMDKLPFFRSISYKLANL